MGSYTFGRTVDLSFADAVARVTQALGDEGFGVLTQIDVAATLKKKLDQTLPPYLILGACNPQLASKAIAAEPQIGALLPCNVVVRTDEHGQTRVEIMDPLAILALVDRPEVSALAQDVRQHLERVLAALPEREPQHPA